MTDMNDASMDEEGRLLAEQERARQAQELAEHLSAILGATGAAHDDRDGHRASDRITRRERTRRSGARSADDLRAQ